MAKKKTCENCEKVIRHIKRTLVSYCRRLEDLERLQRRAEGVLPYLNEEMIKVQKKIVFWRGLLELIEPPAKFYTGIFPGKGREVVDRRKGKK